MSRKVFVDGNGNVKKGIQNYFSGDAINCCCASGIPMGDLYDKDIYTVQKDDYPDTKTGKDYVRCVGCNASFGFTRRFAPRTFICTRCGTENSIIPLK